MVGGVLLYSEVGVWLYLYPGLEQRWAYQVEIFYYVPNFIIKGNLFKMK